MIKVAVYYLDWEKTGVPVGAFDAVENWDTGYYKTVLRVELHDPELVRENVPNLMFHSMNNGSGGEVPAFLGSLRSMSVGDIVEVDGRYFVVNATGWFEVFLKEKV